MAIRPTVYIRFSSERLQLRRVGSGERIEGSPEIEYEADTFRVLRIGAMEPRLSAVRKVVGNGFASTRTIIGDVDLAELSLLYFLDELRRKSARTLPFRLKPDLVLHPHVGPGVELTSFELQGLVDLGKRCGGRRVQVWIGRELTDAEILGGAFNPARKSSF